ncbi:MAG: glycosyltransferase family 2 protein [Bacteroidales bacterium]|nr:glycosyltransferase family 2 protein [Bacteroidales bacterium]
MKLTVVIVNYNVEHFLEQCLYSVRRAMKGVEGEVYVVDNNSVDGSLKMLAEKFPEVKVIANKVNVGFAKANNQAIRISSGEYVLLLNPDTVVEDDTFTKTIAFMDSHPDAGGLGVKMVDGKGQFLPESKRGLPTPMTAFYKIFGLSKLFPHSRRFAQYHLGYLDDDEINPVDILAGAFMLMRRATLDKCGLLDETFFMYGEDVDLSYRITLAGYKNYYFPETRIIHYKGESTKKTTVNYVLVFYKAMEIFAKKHFAKKRAHLFSFVINLAIYFRAFLALVSQFVSKVYMPLSDILLGYGGLTAIGYLWGHYTVYEGVGSYPVHPLFTIILPVYLLIWLLTSYFTGGYDKPYKVLNSVGGVLTGSVLVLVFYALLPEGLRFSRALILFGMIWMAVAVSITRSIGYMLKLSDFQYGKNAKKRFLVIGREDESRRVGQLLRSTSIKPDFVGFVSPDENYDVPDNYIGNISQVPDIIEIYKITEIIFCSKDITHQNIIDKMVQWHAPNLDYKIAPEDTLSIIGSNSINTRGDLYTVDIRTINTVPNRRRKFLFDFFVSFFGIVFWVFLAWFINRPADFLRNCLKVLLGKCSWVGYCSVADRDSLKLPEIKEGVYDQSSGLKDEIDDDARAQLNVIYARDYSISKDFNILQRTLLKR